MEEQNYEGIYSVILSKLSEISFRIASCLVYQKQRDVALLRVLQLLIHDLGGRIN